MPEEVVGARLPRYDGRQHVTGRTIYVDDIYLRGMLWVKVKGSPYSNARIVGIDTSRAEALPSVHAVVTHRDVPRNRYGAVPDQPVLADEWVRHLGQPVAAVAAESAEVAAEAVELIRVDYEVSPPLFDVHEAMKGGAPHIHDGGNVARFGLRDHRQIRMGDVERAFAASDLVVEESYSTQMREHCPLEPHSSVAFLDPTGRVVVHTVSQQVHLDQAVLAHILGLPLNRVRLIGGTVGGAFGSKHEVICDHITALLALKTGRPVKWTWTREEEFLLSSVSSPYPVISYKTGVLRDGTILGLWARFIQDTGAFHIFGTMGINKVAMLARGPYNIPNYWFDGYVVYTNKAASGALRGFNIAEATFAWESHMDVVAAKLGLDPVALRRKNALAEGDPSATQSPLQAVSARAVLEAAAKAAGYEIKGASVRRPPKPAPSHPARRRGLGVCLTHQAVGRTFGGDPGMATVLVNADGTVQLSVGSVDHGQGMKTVFAQMVAQELGVSFASVVVVNADTDTTPFDAGSAANRSTYMTGNAVKRAAADARRLLLEVAAEELGVPPQGLACAGGLVFALEAPEQRVAVGDLAARAVYKQGKLLLGQGHYMANAGPVDEETGAGRPFEAFSYAACLAEVEVDTETGETEVQRLIMAYDAGKAINPSLVEGQMQGGAAMGLGFALLEDMLPRYPGVEPMTTNFNEYKIATSLDVPEIVPIIVEVPAAKGPFGAKGMGEYTANAQAPAIVNAICDAVGVRIRDLPATPEKVLRALHARGEAATLAGGREP